MGLPPRLTSSRIISSEIVVQTKFPQKKHFYAKFLAPVGASFPPILTPFLHFLPSRMPGGHNFCYPVHQRILGPRGHSVPTVGPFARMLPSPLSTLSPPSNFEIRFQFRGPFKNNLFLFTFQMIYLPCPAGTFGSPFCWTPQHIL